MQETGIDSKSITRRRFLGLAWVAALFALIGQVGAALVTFMRPRIKPGAFGTKIKAGRVNEFAVGSIAHVQTGKFYISRLDSGFLAMWQRCPHLGCTVPWIEEEDRFNCPCHSGIFDKKGEVVAGPPPRPLDLFPIEIVDGEVFVDTGQVIQRNRFDESQVTEV
jgi:cytochrome b6-f complex iron-sulfur subunit